MKKENIFRVGPIVSGESMIGYQRYFDELAGYALYTGSSKGVSVSGMHQFGKTSLMRRVCDEAEKQRDLYVSVFVDLAELDRGDVQLMFELMKIVTYKLKREIAMRALKDNWIAEDIDEILSSKKDNTMLRETFKRLFEDVGAHFHIIFVIDEFDSATKFSVADDELLRSIMTTPKYNTSLFLVSRRQIKFIVNDNRNNSTLPSSVEAVHICGFNEEDKAEFYRMLENGYDTALSSTEKETIEFHAGIAPSIYSRIGALIASNRQQEKEVDISLLCRKQANEILLYYETVLSRLEADNILKDLYSVVIGPNIGLTNAKVGALESIGYLTFNGENYYSFSPYFTSLLHNQKIEVSEWEHLIAVERKIKGIVEEQLIRFDIQATDKEKYECLLKEMYSKRGTTYNPNLYNRFIETSQQNFHHQCTLLDVVSFKVTISSMVSPLWTECFAQYFDNTPYREWEMMFKLCGQARDPLAHGHKEFLSAADCSMVTSYCTKILETLAKTVTKADKSKMLPPIWLQKLLDQEKEDISDCAQQNGSPGVAAAQTGDGCRRTGIMTYLRPFLARDNKINGVVGYVDSPENEGILHISRLKDGYIKQESMKQFIRILEQKRQIQVTIDVDAMRGLQFSLIGVSPGFDELIKEKR